MQFGLVTVTHFLPFYELYLIPVLSSVNRYHVGMACCAGWHTRLFTVARAIRLPTLFRTVISYSSPLCSTASERGKLRFRE